MTDFTPRSPSIYTPAELTANQLGRLTPAQAEWLRAHVALRQYQVRNDWIQFIFIAAVLTGGSALIGIVPIGLCLSIVFLIVFLLQSWMKLRRRWNLHILADADEGRVSTATGTVTLSTRKLPEDPRQVQYWLHMGDLNLLIDALTYDQMDQLNPDDFHTVYYAPRSKIAVLVHSREGSFIWDEVRELPKPNPEDHEHNERNRLGPTQTRRLRNELLVEWVSFIWGVIAVLVMFGFGVAVLINFMSAPVEWFYWIMPISMMGLPLFHVIRGNLQRTVRNLLTCWQDLQEGVVQTVEGPLTFDDSLAPNGFYRIRVGVEVLNIRQQLIYMLQEGNRYRVYFLPNSQVMVSIESLSTNSNPQDESQSS